MNDNSQIYRNAVRLLFILVNCSDSFSDENEPEYSQIFRGKAKLYAMDFWIRYPDYLAYELLTIIENEGKTKYLKDVQSILDNEEPDLRKIPMIRFRFGAYEDLNNTLSVLVSKGLIKPDGNKSSTGIQQHFYLISKKAISLVQAIPKEFPILEWYNKRTLLINDIAENQGGSRLKERQYQVIDYAQTKLGGVIPSIKNAVIEKLENIENIS